MTQHTPGPWAVKEYNNGHTNEFGLHGVFREREEGQQHTPIVEKVWGPSLAESDANASLIAAAPELLEAAKKALDFIHSLPYEPSIAGSTKAQDALVDAIAKATGSP